MVQRLLSEVPCARYCLDSVRDNLISAFPPVLRRGSRAEVSAVYGISSAKPLLWKERVRVDSSVSAAYLRLDVRCWDQMRSQLPRTGLTAIAPIAASATLLALWFREAGLGNATQSQAQAVLHSIGIRDQNPSRGIKNSDWLQSRTGGQIVLNPAAILKRSYSQSASAQNPGRSGRRLWRPRGPRICSLLILISGRHYGSQDTRLRKSPGVQFSQTNTSPSIAAPMDQEDGISKTPGDSRVATKF